MKVYNLRRSSASGVYYGERIQTGTRREIMDWLNPVLERRMKSGWNVSRVRNQDGEVVYELQHDDRADVVWFTFEEVDND